MVYENLIFRHDNADERLFFYSENVIALMVKYDLKKHNDSFSGLVDSQYSGPCRNGFFSPYAFFAEFEADVWQNLLEYWNKMVFGFPEGARPMEIASAFAQKYPLRDFQFRRDSLIVNVSEHEYKLFVANLGIDFAKRDRFVAAIHQLRIGGYISNDEESAYYGTVLVADGQAS